MSTTAEMLGRLLSTADDDRAQGLAEYALILALIAVVAIVAVTYLGSALSGELTTIGQSVNAATR